MSARSPISDLLFRPFEKALRFVSVILGALRCLIAVSKSLYVQFNVVAHGFVSMN
jgi:hypothetical protein